MNNLIKSTGIASLLQIPPKWVVFRATRQIWMDLYIYYRILSVIFSKNKENSKIVKASFVTSMRFHIWPGQFCKYLNSIVSNVIKPFFFPVSKRMFLPAWVISFCVQRPLNSELTQWRHKSEYLIDIETFFRISARSA